FNLVDPAHRINIVEIPYVATDLLVGQGQVFLRIVQAIGADNAGADFGQLLVQAVHGALQTADDLRAGGIERSAVRFQIGDEGVQIGEEAAAVEIHAFDGFVADERYALCDRYISSQIITLVHQAGAGIGNRGRVQFAAAEQVIAIFILCV